MFSLLLGNELSRIVMFALFEGITFRHLASRHVLGSSTDASHGLPRFRVLGEVEESLTELVVDFAVLQEKLFG